MSDKDSKELLDRYLKAIGKLENHYERKDIPLDLCPLCVVARRERESWLRNKVFFDGWLAVKCNYCLWNLIYGKNCVAFDFGFHTIPERLYRLAEMRRMITYILGDGK